MQEVILKIRYFERGSSTLFFLPNPVPINVQSYQKQKRPGTSNQSFFRLWNKLRKIHLLVIYYLTKFDDVIKSSCWVISKITSANLWKPIHDIINYSTSVHVLLYLESVESLDIRIVFPKTMKYWVGVQRGQSYLMRRRCLFSLG